MKPFIACLVCVIFLLSCNSEGTVEKNSFDLEAVKKHILSMNEKYGDRFTQNDSSMYSQRYCKGIQIFPPNQALLSGREAVRNFNYNNGLNKELTIEVSVLKIHGTADLVVEEGTYSFPDGKGGFFDKGKFIALWKQEDGQWKLFREIWNTDTPVQSGN